MTPKDCVQALERIVPLKLAGDWDNVGLLVEGPDSRRVRRVLLTNPTVHGQQLQRFLQEQRGYYSGFLWRRRRT